MIGALVFLAASIGCVALVAAVIHLDTKQPACIPPPAGEEPSTGGPPERLLPIPTLVIECACGGWDELYDTAVTAAHTADCRWNFHVRVGR